MTATKPLRDRTHTFIEVFKKLFQCHEGSTYNQGIHPKDASIINQAPTYRHRPPESVGCSRMAKPNKASEVKKKSTIARILPSYVFVAQLDDKGRPITDFLLLEDLSGSFEFQRKASPQNVRHQPVWSIWI